MSIVRLVVLASCKIMGEARLGAFLIAWRMSNIITAFYLIFIMKHTKYKHQLFRGGV